MTPTDSSLGPGATAIASRFWGMRVASEADNQSILGFVQARKMDLEGGGKGSGLVVNYRRAPNYFSFLELQGDTHIVYLQEDESKALKGIGSFVYRDGYWNGELTRVGYVGDLRIAAYRLGQVQWRKLYAEHLAFTRQQGVAAHFTAILDDNIAAKRSLVDEASAKNGYAYDELYRYQMVNVLGRVPFVPRRRLPKAVEWRLFRMEQAHAVGSGRSLSVQELQAFLATLHEGLPFGYAFSDRHGAGSKGSAWGFRVARWPGFQASRFVVVTSPAGEIVACCLPWAPRGAKSVILERSPWALKMARQALNALGTKPPLPADGGRLEFLYLTHLTFSPKLSLEERAWCLEGFLDFAQQDAKEQGCHLVSFADPRGANALVPLLGVRGGGGLVLQTVPVTLYSVRERAQPVFRASALGVQESGVGFELALI